MKVKELVTLFRRQSEDATIFDDMPNQFSLWSNFQLIQYLNQAQNEFAERTFCFKDDTTFNIEIEADTAKYELDSRILRIERAEVISTKSILDIKSIEEFVMSAGGSWEERVGPPRILITDIVTDEVRVYPIPEEDLEIKLTVRRLPLEQLITLEDDIEIPERYQFGLLYRMQKEAYSTPTALTAGFGDALVIATSNWDTYLNTASRTFKIKTRGPGKIRYGGI